MRKYFTLLLFLYGCTASQKNTAINKTPFNFFVLGDWGRKGGLSQKEVANQMIEKAKILSPNFIITVGDNFYEDGVQSVNDTHWDSSYKNIYKELTTKYDWYIDLGNHDYRGKPQAEIDYHKKDKHWILPERYYTKVFETNDHQKVRFLFIDTSPFYTDYYTDKRMPEIKLQDTAAQIRWIEKTLAQAKEPWKIVVGHHPVYSSSLKKGDTKELVQMFAPIFEKYRVQAYICGHNHDLQHNNPKNSYTDYFVSGAGSEEKTGPFGPSKFSENIGGFADIKIKNDSLSLDFINKNGVVIYHYQRGRS